MKNISIAAIIQCSKNYGSPTRITVKVALNMKDPNSVTLNLTVEIYTIFCSCFISSKKPIEHRIGIFFQNKTMVNGVKFNSDKHFNDVDIKRYRMRETPYFYFVELKSSKN